MSEEYHLQPTAMRVVYCTCPDQAVARELARTAVTERLAACANLVPAVTSIYRWQGELCEDGEVLLMIKTTAAACTALEQLIRRLHPYETPEFVVVQVAAASPDYLQWVLDECAPMETKTS
ncbi:MAG: divalent-cation tolerance protein CutA [Wenzhouxiangellaceae bacterium]